MLRQACSKLAVRQFPIRSGSCVSQIPNVFSLARDSDDSPSDVGTHRLPNMSMGRRQLHISSSTMMMDASPLPENVLAATSFEQLALFFSPTQLGVQLWETVHTATGLPWWASIPLTAVALKTALLPLSAKARAASSNFALMQEAVDQSRMVSAEFSAEESRAVGRYRLVKKTFNYLKAQHGAPSLRWFFVNAAVQVPLFVTLTMSLRRMSANLWPGLVDQGLFIFRDLTPPALYLDTMSTPFGTAGAIFPLAIALLYARTVDLSAAGRSAAISAAMKLALLPGYCAALLQPHAVLLYWASQTALSAAQLQWVLAKPNALTRFAKVPSFILQAPTAPTTQAEAKKKEGDADETRESKVVESLAVTEEVKQDDASTPVVMEKSVLEKKDSKKDAKLLEKAERLRAIHAWEEEERRRVALELEGLLLHLADDFAAVKNVPAARACLRRLLVDQPAHAGALERWEALKQRINADDGNSVAGASGSGAEEKKA